MKKIAKTFIAIAVILSLGYIVVNHYLDKWREQEEREERASLERAALQKAVADLAKKHNAIDDWDNELFGDGSMIMKPVLSMELEKLWIGERPILFIGFVRDIATYDAQNYKINLVYGMSGAFILIHNRLEMEIITKKDETENFIENFKNRDEEIFGGVAANVRVEEIDSRGLIEGENKLRVLTGKGKCVELAYIRDLSELDWWFLGSEKKYK